MLTRTVCAKVYGCTPGEYTWRGNSNQVYPALCLWLVARTARPRSTGLHDACDSTRAAPARIGGTPGCVGADVCRAPRVAVAEHGTASSSQPFFDFPAGPVWWGAEEYKWSMEQIARQKMIFLGLHTYLRRSSRI
jgi:hypothetical protein